MQETRFTSQGTFDLLVKQMKWTRKACWRLICVHADGLFKVQESLNKIVFVLN